MRLNFLLLCLTLYVAQGFSQTAKISGTVKTRTGAAIANANVSIRNSARGAQTDKSGSYTIELSAGAYKLTVSCVGFATQTKSVTLALGESTSIDFILSEKLDELDEVVVTADKTETDLQRTPIAVSALDAKQLQAYRVWNIADLTALAPSLYTVEHANSSGGNFFNIRGTLGFTNEQAVAVYIDDVYQFNFYSAPMQLLDIERIEILRGPQGTLYGRNAFGGVVNIITRKPTNQTTGFVELSGGNFGQQRYAFSVSTPLVANTLFAGIAAMYNGRGAVYQNTLGNQASDFDRQDAFTGNLNLRYVPTESFSLAFNLKGEANNDRGSYPWVASDSAALQNPYRVSVNYPNTEARHNISASLATNYYSDALTLTAVSAYTNYRLYYPDRFDFDFTALDVFSGASDSRQNNWTQEIRLASPTNSKNAFQWTAGAFGFIQSGDGTSDTFAGNAAAAFDTLAPYQLRTLNTTRNSGIAFFGQAAYAVTQQFKLTLGLRYDIENRRLSQRSEFIKEPIPPVTTSPLTEYAADFAAFTPKISAAYQFNDNTLLYGSFARGFRAGGLNAGAANPADIPYQPEFSNNIEIGLKNTFWDNRVRLNLTLFYLQQRGQQITTTFNALNFQIVNVGDMDNRGAELELSVLPVRGLQLDWNVGYSNAEYTRLELFDFAIGQTRDFRGNRPIYNPPVSSMLAAQYDFPILSGEQGLNAFVRAEYRYIDRFYYGFYNTNSQSGYGLINARIGISIKNGELAFWGRNLSDARYFTWGTLTPLSESYMLGNPRMLGVTLTARL